MASDQIIICDHIKFKIFEPGILLVIVEDMETTRSSESLRKRTCTQIMKE